MYRMGTIWLHESLHMSNSFGRSDITKWMLLNCWQTKCVTISAFQSVNPLSDPGPPLQCPCVHSVAVQLPANGGSTKRTDAEQLSRNNASPYVVCDWLTLKHITHVTGISSVFLTFCPERLLMFTLTLVSFLHILPLGIN